MPVIEPPPEDFKQIATNTIQILLTAKFIPEDENEMVRYRGHNVKLVWDKGDVAFIKSLTTIESKDGHIMADIRSGLSNSWEVSMITAIMMSFVMYYGPDMHINDLIIRTAEYIRWWSTASSQNFTEFLQYPYAVPNYVKMTTAILSNL